MLTFRGHGGGSEKKFPFQKLQKRRFWNQQEHTQKVTSKQMPAVTPRTEEEEEWVGGEGGGL